MKSRIFQQVRTALLTLACVALATPVWAQDRNCGAYCQGIDRCGCLTNCGGESCTFSCVLNTRTCRYTGSCRCKIQNHCRKSQCYKNVSFCQDPCFRCSCSAYSCDSCGNCCYTASGCYESSQPV